MQFNRDIAQIYLSSSDPAPTLCEGKGQGLVTVERFLVLTSSVFLFSRKPIGLQLNYYVTCGNRRLHYYYGGYTLLVMYSCMHVAL